MEDREWRRKLILIGLLNIWERWKKLVSFKGEGNKGRELL